MLQFLDSTSAQTLFILRNKPLGHVLHPGRIEDILDRLLDETPFKKILAFILLGAIMIFFARRAGVVAVHILVFAAAILPCHARSTYAAEQLPCKKVLHLGLLPCRSLRACLISSARREKVVK